MRDALIEKKEINLLTPLDHVHDKVRLHVRTKLRINIKRKTREREKKKEGGKKFKVRGEEKEAQKRTKSQS